MPTQRGRVNRGPAAAAGNRQSILGAARRLFADRGYSVPLSAVAQAAGTGQGVLYRHFSSRLDLALAVFEDHFVELERLAADPGPAAFFRLWEHVLDFTVEESAFVEMVVDARRSLPDYGGADRLRGLVEATLPRARGAGLVAADVTVDGVLLAWRMAFGVVVTATDPADLRDLVDRALSLPPVPGRARTHDLSTALPDPTEDSP